MIWAYEASEKEKDLHACKNSWGEILTFFKSYLSQEKEFAHADYKKIVQNYIAAYNNFDIEGMVSNLHRDVTFKNISEGKITLQLVGKKAFLIQATEAKKLFKQREMKILKELYNDNVVEVEIEFTGTFHPHFFDDSKNSISIKGRSIFSFKDGKIISIEDIS